MRQVETSRTLVFDAAAMPARSSRRCVADNIDLGRPENVELLFRPAEPRRPTAQRRPAGSRPRSTRDCDWSPSTSSTSTPGSSSTSRTAARCASRPSSTHPPTCGCSRRCTTSPNCRTRPVRSTPGCWILNGPARACVLASPVFERITSPPSRGGQEGPALRFGDLRARPWPAPSPPCCSRSPASPTRACAP